MFTLLGSLSRRRSSPRSLDGCRARCLQRGQKIVRCATLNARQRKRRSLFQLLQYAPSDFTRADVQALVLATEGLHKDCIYLAPSYPLCRRGAQVRSVEKPSQCWWSSQHVLHVEPTFRWAAAQDSFQRVRGETSMQLSSVASSIKCFNENKPSLWKTVFLRFSLHLEQHFLARVHSLSLQRKLSPETHSSHQFRDVHPSSSLCDAEHSHIGCTSTVQQISSPIGWTACTIQWAPQKDRHTNQTHIGSCAESWMKGCRPRTHDVDLKIHAAQHLYWPPGTKRGASHENGRANSL